MDKIEKTDGSRPLRLPKDEARQRLADSLRANLGRRKIQQRERKRNQDASMTATKEAGTGPADPPVLPDLASEGEEPLKQI
jgi:hypothetical protein